MEGRRGTGGKLIFVLDVALGGFGFGFGLIDPSQPDLITIEGTMQLCEALGVDPENVSQNPALH